MHALRPLLPPFEEGSLAVSSIHRIHYALYGTPHGTPVHFLHGGPGCGCDDEDARWFDPESFLVVTHDQRGSGKSFPWAETRENTPQDLVGDIERLRRHLHVDRPFLIFAGSWGTTLALLYAQAYPLNVAGMILRGVFTCGWEDQDYFYSEMGAARFSPAAWEKFVASLPPGTDRIQERLYHLFEGADEEGKRKWCSILSDYEYSFFDLPAEELGESASAFENQYPEMRINNHYQAHRFFLEDGQILKNAGRIEEIPVTIVHGMRDVICPPMIAWKLHRRLPKSTMVFVQNAGHLSSDPGIREALLEAVEGWRVNHAQQP